jgi:hypothetical protein
VNRALTAVAVAAVLLHITFRVLQYCRMAADPASALLLQPACTGVSDLHTFIAASFLGPVLYMLTSGSSNSSISIANPAACASMPMAARVLGWYAQASYGLLMPVAGFCTLEWRMKARWVKQKLGRQLVYGPWGWPSSQHDRGLLCWVQNFTTWVLSIAAGMGLLWVALTWVVPQLPLMECQTCADSGTCLELQCGEWLLTQRIAAWLVPGSTPHEPVLYLQRCCWFANASKKHASRCMSACACFSSSVSGMRRLQEKTNTNTHGLPSICLSCLQRRGCAAPRATGQQSCSTSSSCLS